MRVEFNVTKRASVDWGDINIDVEVEAVFYDRDKEIGKKFYSYHEKVYGDDIERNPTTIDDAIGRCEEKIEEFKERAMKILGALEKLVTHGFEF